MFHALNRWRRERILARHRIPDDAWRRVLKASRSVAHLYGEDLNELRDLASLFLHEKDVVAAAGFAVTPHMRARIACEAAVPILHLGLSSYRSFHSVIVYGDTFLSRDAWMDEAGVLHSDPEERAGEAWPRGPVIVSWADIEGAPAGYNVVIHEMAHKLDMQDGDPNGCPPLHRGMDRRQWAAAFTEAYEEEVARVEADEAPVLDDYAASDPGEFFAVASEAFFETPEVLKENWPKVYKQLALYYRQDTAR